MPPSISGEFNKVMRMFFQRPAQCFFADRWCATGYFTTVKPDHRINQIGYGKSEAIMFVYYLSIVHILKSTHAGGPLLGASFARVPSSKALQ